MADLPVVNIDGSCPACEQTCDKTSFRFDYEDKVIERGCYRCRYRWQERPHFSGTAHIFFRLYRDDHDCPACGSGEKIESNYAKSNWDFDYHTGGCQQPATTEYFAAILGENGAYEKLPFVVRRCQNCTYAWPEMPLNRSDDVPREARS